STEPLEINAGRPTRRLDVTNRGDRPVQVGSHCHFFEVNRFLDFDREAGYGMRLNIAAGTAVRFEPGDTREGELEAIGGRRAGGGKVIRDGMGQSPRVSRHGGSPDLVITSVVIVDSTGIYKADVGVRDGCISAIGKSGNPGVMDGVTEGLEIGASTEIVAGEGH